MIKKKSSSIIDRAIAKVLTNLNVNTVLLALITGYFGIQNSDMQNKQDTTIAQVNKVDSSNIRSASWQLKRDSINKIFFAKLDTIISQTKKQKK